MKKRLFFIIGAFLTCGITYAQAPADWQTSVNSIKSLIKSNPQEATKQANEMIKGKNKKNVQLIIAISRAYLDAQDFPNAELYLAAAQKADKKDPLVSILEGDIYLAKNDPGTACQKYEQAIYYDKNCFDAYVKYANVYRGANPEEAINKLEELKSVNPKQTNEVNKTIAKIYYQKNQFDKAAEYYSQFINTPVATQGDIANYGLVLFLNHKFDESLAVAKQGLEKNPRSAVFNRLAMFNNADMKKWDDAAKYADAFFNASDSATYSALDYKYYGFILSSQKKYQEAVGIYQKAIDKDSTQMALYKEMSDAYEQINDYTNAIASFQKYYDSLKKEEQTADLAYDFGKLYYRAGSSYDEKKQTAEAKDAYTKAKEYCMQYIEAHPDLYGGYLNVARSEAGLDPESTSGLAKPYYEKAAEIAASKNDARYNPILIESYRYLAFYYYVKKQNALCKEYANKILAIDANNEIAKKILSAVK